MTQRASSDKASARSRGIPQYQLRARVYGTDDTALSQAGPFPYTTENDSVSHP